jgi:DNA-directed RNA polymerase subunit RPC12/RpoP
MAFVAAKCTNCGGELQLDDNLKTGFCQYCGSKVVVQEAIELKKVQVEGKVSVEGLATVENLLTRGEQSIDEGDYEKAISFFEQAINIDAKNHVAWWGKFNAFFNIEFNSIKGTKASNDCIINAKRAIEYADANKKVIYQNEYEHMIKRFDDKVNQLQLAAIEGNHISMRIGSIVILIFGLLLWLLIRVPEILFTSIPCWIISLILFIKSFFYKRR